MRVAMMLILVAGLASGEFGAAMACSQCMCGAPFPAEALGGVVPTQLTYGFEERYLSKSNALDDEPGVEEEREHRMAAFGLWRPFNNLALLGRVPFNHKTITTRPGQQGSRTESSRGIGDAELLAMIGVFRTPGFRPVAVALVAGGAAPTGSNAVRGGDGERLEQHLQPGSGAWSGTLGLNATGRALGMGAWSTDLLVRTNGTSSHGYHYGNTYLYSGGLTSDPWRGARLIVRVDGRVAARDRTEDGIMDPNTGGAVTYLSPGLRWSRFGLAVQGLLQIPVAQALFGVQTEHTTGQLTIGVAR
jgi:hypothetical protein